MATRRSDRVLVDQIERIGTFSNQSAFICMRFSAAGCVLILRVSTESVVVLPLWQAWIDQCSWKSPVMAKSGC